MASVSCEALAASSALLAIWSIARRNSSAAEAASLIPLASSSVAAAMRSSIFASRPAVFRSVPVRLRAVGAKADAGPTGAPRAARSEVFISDLEPCAASGRAALERFGAPRTVRCCAPFPSDPSAIARFGRAAGFLGIAGPCWNHAFRVPCRGNGDAPYSLSAKWHKQTLRWRFGGRWNISGRSGHGMRRLGMRRLGIAPSCAMPFRSDTGPATVSTGA